MIQHNAAMAHLISANYLIVFRALAPLGTTCGQVVREVPTPRTPGTSAVRTRPGTTSTPATFRALGLFVSVIWSSKSGNCLTKNSTSPMERMSTKLTGEGINYKPSLIFLNSLPLIKKNFSPPREIECRGNCLKYLSLRANAVCVVISSNQ